MVNLSTQFCGIQLKNPVMPAAGPPIRNGQAAIEAARGGAGGIVTKTISVKGAEVPRPCMAEPFKGGFLNTELWSELEPEVWLEKEYPLAKEAGLPMIIGLGYTADEIRQLAPKVAPFADALELSTHYLGGDTSPVEEAVQAAKESCDKPVFVKLSPQVDIPTFAKAAEKAGADGIVLINSFGPCLDIDVRTGRPLMGSETGYGWLSGKAIFPLALRCVYQAAQVVDIPIIGVGGISSGIDAIKMIMAGAVAVQVCTAAILEGPTVYGRIVKEMKRFMEKAGYESLTDFQGLALKKKPERATMIPVTPEVDEETCTACGLCARSCVYQAIVIDEYAKIDPEKCFGCGLCVSRCPVKAIAHNW
ncbi:diguanylate cyclase [Anoxybacter fermentans]|uniref:Dihydroorotate dehydrogenase B (NAD(+)), catalytic subunit n=1 Tax=Anoxybacter fermentans TaxID=1323375 RepID=A0A3S9SZ56_9FIRM|nr:4Fe-4S binding protein [Anoxybacter fermentans]AZR73597.1 diguanylate cyclase [Anoxybacter fermentans]